MRILVVHNRYQIRGGEDAVVEQEVESLRRAGQTVETLFFDNASIETTLDRLRTAWEAPQAPRGIAAVVAATRAFRPDVVHIHNVFPLISPGVHAAIRATGTATVQTLHNFRITCANGIMMRDSAPCERCIDGSPYNAVRYRCYRGSRLGSLAVARMIDVHRRRGTWARDVDRFIALSAFARDRFLAAGVPASRIRVKPNGLADPGVPKNGPRSGILFVGRFSTEKGIAPLIAAAALTRAPIRVIGEGPLEAMLRDVPNLTLIGYRDRDAVRKAMEAAAALVVPSLCYEGLPMVIAEAFAVATPVVASRIGALADLVVDGVTGLHAEAGDPADLARALDRIIDEPHTTARMGAAARETYERTWTEASVTAQALTIYRDAIAARAAEQPISTR
ncbi:glycosyltransferase family 4 protein [Methylobacterium sp. BTF04]|nr:glycosyltransferase family 4 protein [Methylobacterium sp. BTF04]